MILTRVCVDQHQVLLAGGGHRAWTHHENVVVVDQVRRRFWCAVSSYYGTYIHVRTRPHAQPPSSLFMRCCRRRLQTLAFLGSTTLGLGQYDTPHHLLKDDTVHSSSLATAGQRGAYVHTGHTLAHPQLRGSSHHPTCIVFSPHLSAGSRRLARNSFRSHQSHPHQHQQHVRPSSSSLPLLPQPPTTDQTNHDLPKNRIAAGGAGAQADVAGARLLVPAGEGHGRGGARAARRGGPALPRPVRDMKETGSVGR